MARAKQLVGRRACRADDSAGRSAQRAQGALDGLLLGPGNPRTEDIASLGETASHGCIRMSIKDVKELSDEVKEGTPVFVQ